MDRFRTSALFIALSAIWGTAFVAITVGLESIPPVLFASFRYDIAGLFLFGYVALFSDRWKPRTRADWVAILAGALLLICAYNALLFVGQQGVSSGVAAILVATSPVLTTGFSRLLLPEYRLTGPDAVGLALGFLGVILVAIPDPTSATIADVVAPGLVFLAAVTISLGSVVIQRVDASISTEGLTAWSFVLGALALHVVSLLPPAESPGDVVVTTESLLALLYLALAASVAGYLVYFRLLSRLGAVQINLVAYTAPVFATVGGWLLLGETLTLPAIVGFGVIASGFVLLKRRAVNSSIEAIRL